MIISQRSFKNYISQFLILFEIGVDHMKRLPIGVENFKEIMENNYYYIDKTDFINDICNEKVVLYTRPRRFHRNSVDTFGIRQEAR